MANQSNKIWGVKTMGNGKKFASLIRYFAELKVDAVYMTFEHIEKIICNP